MKILKLALYLSLSVACIACLNATNNKEQATQEKLQVQMAPQPTILGNDSDEHGCKASAGYTWSQLLGECIRVWETGTPVQYTDTTASYKKAVYAIFNADSTQVEIMSINGEHPILTQQGSEKQWVSGDKKIKLQQTEKGLILLVCQ
jgi:hypothetical protein